MYPRNAVAPERLAIGAVVQISDGVVQTSAVTITVRGQGGAEGTGGGTTAFGASGVVYYTPTQAETNFTSFVVIASKTGCIPVSQTIVTTASVTPGQVRLEGVTHTSAVIPTVSAVTGLTAANLDATVSSRMATYTQPTGFLAATFPTTVASTTNITAGTITTTTNLTNLPSIPANWITAAGITAAALNGKGDWNIGKTGYTLTATTGLGNQTANITGNLSGSVGSVTGAVGSVTGAVGSVTGSVGSVVGHTPQTGDTYGALGATALAALQLQFDGTGLTGATYPANQAQLSNIAVAGAAANVRAESYTLTNGTQTGGTYTDTAALDTLYHTHTDTGGAMDLYYEFNVTPNGVPVGVTMTGYLLGANDSLAVQAYNWVTTSWEQIGTRQGSNSATVVANTHSLFVAHVGTGANLGKVRVRYYAASGLTSATLAVDQIYVSYANIAPARETKGFVSDVAATTTVVKTTLTQADDFWNDAIVIFTDGALNGQSRTVYAYTNLNGELILDEALTSAPADGTPFIIDHTHVHPITQIQAGLATSAAVAALPTATDNADALLKRDMSAVTGEASRSPINALRFLRNKWSVAATTLTVTKEDDTTSAWTSTVTTNPTAEPITGSDPS